MSKPLGDSIIDFCFSCAFSSPSSHRLSKLHKYLQDKITKKSRQWKGKLISEKFRGTFQIEDLFGHKTIPLEYSYWGSVCGQLKDGNILVDSYTQRVDEYDINGNHITSYPVNNFLTNTNLLVRAFIELNNGHLAILYTWLCTIWDRNWHRVVHSFDIQIDAAVKLKSGQVCILSGDRLMIFTEDLKIVTREISHPVSSSYIYQVENDIVTLKKPNIFRIYSTDLKEKRTFEIKDEFVRSVTPLQDGRCVVSSSKKLAIIHLKDPLSLVFLKDCSEVEYVEQLDDHFLAYRESESNFKIVNSVSGIVANEYECISKRIYLLLKEE
jgi:hypothetical protein